MPSMPSMSSWFGRSGRKKKSTETPGAAKVAEAPAPLPLPPARVHWLIDRCFVRGTTGEKVASWHKGFALAKRG